MRRAVITGIGVVSPAGNTPEEFFDGLLSGKNFIGEIDRFDASRYPSRHAGLVSDVGGEEVFSKRLIKKLDRFSHMALSASDAALKDSGINLDTEDKNRIGIAFGNALGGWSFAEEELRDLWTRGLREVSPYQATAWFPAAPQGQVSIFYGLKGFSKTIISDIASSHLAIAYAARAVKMGRADVMLAGGTEAPVSPYALLCCNTSGELSRTGNYRPFCKSRDGYIIGEGAATLVVEEMGRAVARGARIYAEIKGFGHTSDGMHPIIPDESGEGIARAMTLAIREANIAASGIGMVVPSSNAGRYADLSEGRALSGIFGSEVNKLPFYSPKPQTGNSLGASGAIDTVFACMALSRMETPMLCVDNPEFDFFRRGGQEKLTERNIIINSIGRGGINACLLIGKS